MSVSRTWRNPELSLVVVVVVVVAAVVVVVVVVVAVAAVLVVVVMYDGTRAKSLGLVSHEGEAEACRA